MTSETRQIDQKLQKTDQMLIGKMVDGYMMVNGYNGQYNGQLSWWSMTQLFMGMMVKEHNANVQWSWYSRVTDDRFWEASGFWWLTERSTN